MKSKSIVLIAVSLGFGLVAAIGISQVMGRNQQPPPEKEQTLPVMVSLADLEIHGEINQENVSIEHWPASLVPPDAVSTMEEVEDKLLNCRVAKKMPILKQMVVHRTEVTRLAIPAGYKVVAVKLPAEDVIGGLLNPGDVIDLVGVFSSDKTKVSRTFLTNVRVFSVNNRTTPDVDRGKQGSQGAIVGVLLTRSQAEKLILAQKVAQIKLVLRSQDTDTQTMVAASDLDDIDGFSTADFADEPVDQHQPMGQDDQELDSLLAGSHGDDVIHKMVMVTPEGPISFVFHKDAPLPQKIEGYLMPPKPASPFDAGADDVEPADDFMDDSEDFNEDAVEDDPMDSSEAWDFDEESSPAENP
jgi:pilus assembly protein CpaB